MTNAFIAPDGASQPQRYVIGAGETLDDVQASGEWIAAEPDAVVDPDP